MIVKDDRCKIPPKEYPPNYAWYNKSIFFKYSLCDILKSFIAGIIIIICISLVSIYTHIQIENLKESKRFVIVNDIAIVSQKNLRNAINKDTKIVTPNFTVDSILELSPDSNGNPIAAYILKDEDTNVKYLYMYVGGRHGGPTITRYWDKE